MMIRVTVALALALGGAAPAAFLKFELTSGWAVVTFLRRVSIMV